MVEKILEWSNKIDLFNKSNKYAQGIKFVEEVGETADAYRKNNVEEMLDGFGDMIVVATNLLVLQKIEKEIVVELYRDAINHNHLWITDTGVVSFDTLLNQALQFKIDVSMQPRMAITPYKSLVSACNTFITYLTKGEETIESVLKNKVLKTINSRVDGIIIDDRGFAIKAEDRG